MHPFLRRLCPAPRRHRPLPPPCAIPSREAVSRFRTRIDLADFRQTNGSTVDLELKGELISVLSSRRIEGSLGSALPDARRFISATHLGAWTGAQNEKNVVFAQAAGTSQTPMRR